jgi:hypothetical protein
MATRAAGALVVFSFIADLFFLVEFDFGLGEFSPGTPARSVRNAYRKPRLGYHLSVR